MKKRSPIIIFGGMGPQASIELVRLVIGSATKKFGVRDCVNFPEIILNSLPVPDFIEGKQNEQKLINILNSRINYLRQFNPSCFCFACNTVHLFLDKLSFPSDVKFISMIDELVLSVKTSKSKRIGLLASPLTINSKLYQAKIEKNNMSVILPNNKQVGLLNKIIRDVIAGKNLNDCTQNICTIALSLKKKGIDCIVLGCTEFPLIFPKKFSLPVFNSLEILSNKLLETYYNSNNPKN